MFPRLLFSVLIFLSFERRVVLGIYEDAPGIAMDYKIHVDPGKEDCYYQVGDLNFILKYLENYI